MMRIEIPWPSSGLTPNAKNRQHWRVNAKHISAYRDQCHWLGIKAKPVWFLPEGNIPVSIVFHPPDRRRRDLDSMLASLKNGLDGLCLAWGIDDVRFRPMTLDVGEPVKGGNVVITFQP